MPNNPTVPGVYSERRVRTSELPFVRTDVAGFIGFESRVVNGTNPSRLIGGPPPIGHEFNVDVSAFELVIGEIRVRVPAMQNLILSSDPESIPIGDGQSLVYALVVMETGEQARLVITPGAPAISGREQSAADDQIGLRVGDGQWVRFADIHVSRKDRAVFLTAVPRLPPARLDDWKDFIQIFGDPPKDGSLLAAAVRGYFANGGRRCYVTTVRRPDFTDNEALRIALDEMVGVRGESEIAATGLERLLLIPDVSVVDVPDLYAPRLNINVEPFNLPATIEEASFQSCTEMTHDVVDNEVRSRSAVLDPVFDDPQVEKTQIRMLRRCIDERWRVLLLLTIPLERDPVTGRFRGPDQKKAKTWTQKLAAIGEDPEKMSCAALYFPWLLSQEQVGVPVTEMPPTPFVAGIIARRNRSRGAHVAPANETLRGVVGLTQPIDDKVNGELYELPSNINVLRAFPGFGVQLWGARTLSADKWLRYIAVRRCLSAIQRRAVAALQPLMFEPNSALLWLQITQQMLGILLPIFESGTLRGSRPEEAFYVRCDASVNPPEQTEAGILICEVGVAVSASAEFIVFRLGRREGVVEVIE